jgi:hypothetical protein
MRSEEAGNRGSPRKDKMRDHVWKVHQTDEGGIGPEENEAESLDWEMFEWWVVRAI